MRIAAILELLLGAVLIAGTFLGIAVNVVLLVIPYYYLHNAWLNFKDKK
ncbi:MAG TPA: hypothetical protein H9799_03845 [Candidatus Mediterraneibacter merdipullorum]|nr:hypothetical protein [Candidatus Mediterraneibacter merdipullorum]